MKPQLLGSFSGGRTSAKMCYELKEKYSDRYEMRFAFANTGREDERTLDFVDRCDREFGLEVVWLEAVVHYGQRIGNTHRIVTFETASRNGEPFEATIQKYGIPCQPFPHCTRELKLNPIRSWLAEIGWSDCLRAVGIRADEPARLPEDPEAFTTETNIVYPMAYWFPMTKPEVNDWWKKQPFDLGLKDYEGNCTFCWKKHTPKLVRIAQERPEVFDWPAQMEERYPRVGPEFIKADGATRPDRTFFRKRLSAKGLIQIAADATVPPWVGADEDAVSCSESCEVF